MKLNSDNALINKLKDNVSKDTINFDFTSFKEADIKDFVNYTVNTNYKEFFIFLLNSKKKVDKIKANQLTKIQKISNKNNFSYNSTKPKVNSNTQKKAQSNKEIQNNKSDSEEDFWVNKEPQVINLLNDDLKLTMKNFNIDNDTLMHDINEFLNKSNGTNFNDKVTGRFIKSTENISALSEKNQNPIVKSILQNEKFIEHLTYSTANNKNYDSKEKKKKENEFIEIFATHENEAVQDLLQKYKDHLETKEDRKFIYKKQKSGSCLKIKTSSIEKKDHTDKKNYRALSSVQSKEKIGKTRNKPPNIERLTRKTKVSSKYIKNKNYYLEQKTQKEKEVLAECTFNPFIYSKLDNSNKNNTPKPYYIKKKDQLTEDCTFKPQITHKDLDKFFSKIEENSNLSIKKNKNIIQKFLQKNTTLNENIISEALEGIQEEENSEEKYYKRMEKARNESLQKNQKTDSNKFIYEYDKRKRSLDKSSFTHNQNSFNNANTSLSNNITHQNINNSAITEKNSSNSLEKYDRLKINNIDINSNLAQISNHLGIEKFSSDTKREDDTSKVQNIYINIGNINSNDFNYTLAESKDKKENVFERLYKTKNTGINTASYIALKKEKKQEKINYSNSLMSSITSHLREALHGINLD